MAVTSSGDGNFSSVIAGGLSVNDDVIINHDVTMDGHAPNVNSLVINSGKTLTGGGYKITIDGENSSGFAVDNDGIISGNLDLEINTQASTTCDFQGSSGNFRDVKLNHASVDVHISGNTTFDGNLTIAAGTFDCSNEGGDSRNLTVTGDVSVTGTLNGNASAISLGSLKINSGGTYSATSGTTTITDEATDGVCLRSNGTFTHNSGLVSIETADHTTLVWSSASQRFNNLTVNLGASARVCTLSGQFDSHRYVEGNLTVTNSKFDTNNAGTFRIDGDVSLTSSATLTCGTSTCSFKSMTIASGTTLSASSGTTTITGEPSSGFNLSNSGTFTHNKGTVKVTCATQTTLTGFSGSNAFFNFTYAGTGSGQDQICGANTDFFGQVVIDSANSELQMQQHTFNLYDGIRIKQGGWDIGSSSTSGTINVYGAVRNVGGTVVAS